MDVFDTRTVDAFVELMRDDAFVAMRRAASEAPLAYDEFTRLPKPHGISYGQAWRLLCALRRQLAVTIPLLDDQGRKGWYTPTKSIAENLAALDRKCRAGSVLHNAIVSRNSTYFLLESAIDDAIEAIRGDGLRIGHERARELILEERAPETPEERLIVNARRAMRALDAYDAQPCTPATLRAIHAAVADGMDPQSSPSIPERPVHWKHKERSDEETLALIARIIDGEGVDRREHPLILAQGVRHLFMAALPLPSWNGTVSAVAMKLLYRKAGLPVLAYVPLMKAQRDWMSGAWRPDGCRAPEACEDLIDGEVDFTPYVDVYSKLACLELAEMEREFNRMVQRDARLSEELRGTIDINHRQRMLLQQALNNLDAVFRVETHRAMCNIAYATARADLLGLAELGFLKRTRAGHAFEFTATGDLRRSLDAFLHEEG